MGNFLCAGSRSCGLWVAMPGQQGLSTGRGEKKKVVKNEQVTLCSRTMRS